MHCYRQRCLFRCQLRYRYWNHHLRKVVCLAPHTWWKTKGRDIRWVEVVGFELRACSLITVSKPGEHFRVFGDNHRVVEGWWKGRSHNKEMNHVFQQIHNISATYQCIFITCYVTSKENPADGPSHGIYLTFTSLPPIIPIPKELQQFIVDCNCKSFSSEHSLHISSYTWQPLPKPEKDHTCFRLLDNKFNNYRQFWYSNTISKEEATGERYSRPFSHHPDDFCCQTFNIRPTSNSQFFNSSPPLSCLGPLTFMETSYTPGFKWLSQSWYHPVRRGSDSCL